MNNSKELQPELCEHECAIEGQHSTCVCVKCGELFPASDYVPPVSESSKEPAASEPFQIRPVVSVVVECAGRTYRVIDNLRSLIGSESNRNISEQIIGRKILDLARPLDAGKKTYEPE